MKHRAWSLACALSVAGCARAHLPGGYSVEESATDREWLKRPNGTLVTGGLVKALYKDEDTLVLIAHAASEDGKAVPPLPMDGSCFVAMLIKPRQGGEQQIPLARAQILAKGMTEVIATNRPCY
jgi:hypothetical protein